MEPDNKDRGRDGIDKGQSIHQNQGEDKEEGIEKTQDNNEEEDDGTDSEGDSDVANFTKTLKPCQTSNT